MSSLLRSALALTAAAALANGCTCNGRGAKGGAPGGPSASGAQTPAAAQSAAPSSVSGKWNRDRFEARSALVDVQETWMTVTLLAREAKCGEQRPRATDTALQLVIPTGPDNDLYAGRWIALPTRMHGAGSADVPASGSWVKLDRVERAKSGIVRGRLEMSYRTGLDADAPAYEVSGNFEATVCQAVATKASMPQLDRSAPVAGKVAGQPRSFPHFLAFVQKSGNRKPVLKLKGYTRKQVSCYSEEPNTPYLYGPEIGAGPDGKYFVGTPMPAQWVLQFSNEKFGERAVHAGDGAGWIRLDEVELGKNGVVRGEMMAATVAEDDPAWSYELGGKFEAVLCDQPYGMLVPP